MSRGWIGVDFDGTLARYDGYKGATVLGEPIPEMVDRVKYWITQVQEVRIFTARVFPLGLLPTSLPALHEFNVDHLTPASRYEHLVAWQGAHAIQAWCKEHIGVILPITCIKDYHMFELWDDRAVSVVHNSGRYNAGNPLLSPRTRSDIDKDRADLILQETLRRGAAIQTLASMEEPEESSTR